MKIHLVVLLGVVLTCGAAEPTNSDSVFYLRVIDENSAPVVGVSVALYPYSREPDNLKPFVKTETDAQGAFSLNVSNLNGYIVVRKEPFAPFWLQYYREMQSDIHVITLGMPTNVTGIVCDENDKIVPDVEVCVEAAFSETPMPNGGTRGWYLNGKLAEMLFKTRTDSNGKFEIKGLPKNTALDFFVRKPGKILRVPTREYISRETMMAAAGDRDIKLVIEPGGVVTGQVAVPEGIGSFTNIHILLTTERGGIPSGVKPVSPGADGSFKLVDVAAGTYYLRTMFGTNEFPDWVGALNEVVVVSGETNENIKITPIKGGVLEAEVVTAKDHKPVTNASVNAYHAGFQAGSQVDSNGIARLRVAPGEFQVSAYVPNTANKNKQVVFEENKTNHVVFEVSPPPVIQGTVLDTNGQPAVGLIVSIFPNYGGNSNDKMAKTDAKGHYEVSWNQQMYGDNSRPCVVVRDLERNLAAAKDIEDDVTTIDLKLDAGLTISGSVFDEKNAPLTNAVPHIVFWFGNSGMWMDNDKPPKVDDKGRFEVKALPKGRSYSVGIKADGYGSGDTQKLEIDENDAKFEVPAFTLRVANLVLEGIVMDGDDKPVAGANVYTYGEGQPNVSTTSKSDGRFSIKHMCEGTVQISASKNNAYGNARTEGGDTNVVITLGSSSRGSRTAAAPAQTALLGKNLPDVTVAGLAATPAGKRVLLVLFDFEQRPCRRALKVLNDQVEALDKQNVIVIGIHALPATDAFKEWKDSKPVTFPLGSIPEKSDATKWITGAKSFPWLVLTDATGKVTAEGFSLDELDSKLK